MSDDTTEAGSNAENNGIDLKPQLSECGNENLNKNSNSEGRGIEEPSEGQGTQNTCVACEICTQGCCEGGICEHAKSRRSDEGIEQGCREEKHVYCMFRKSTRLLFSGFCMFGVTGLSIADIATDVLTARNYYRSGRITTFALSLVFLILPPILLTAGILKRKDDEMRNPSSRKSCGIKLLIIIANVPLKLYMIWLQLLYSVKCFKRFHHWRIAKCKEREKVLLEGSLQHFVTELILYKLWNSIFESMPQLLLTIHVIMTTPKILHANDGYLLVASSVFSFGSLCVGVIFYSVTSKQSETQPPNSKVTLHPVRSKSTVLGITQIIFLTIYTVCFLISRVLSFSFFIIFFDWYGSIMPAIHWMVAFLFFTYRRYENKNNWMQLYRVKAYHRQSSSFVYVLVHSLMSVFIHVKPVCEELLDQPRYYKIIYYILYMVENSVMILAPFALKDVWSGITDDKLEALQYFPLTYATLATMGVGAITCALYHIFVHKAAKFTREEVFGPCCKCCFGPGGLLCFSCACCCRNKDESKIFVSCKNMYSHEIRSLSLSNIKLWKQSTESKLLNKKRLRKWKIAQNSHKASQTKAGTQHEDCFVIENQPVKDQINADLDVEDDSPYTMRRTGLHIMSDPKGRLFYAPISEIKVVIRENERAI